MRLGTQMALAAGLGLWCALADATSYVTREAREAYEECLARWKDVDGAWEGQLLTPGADMGGPYDKRVNVRLIFSRKGTTLLVKDEPQQPWERVGEDPVAAKRKTDLVIRVRAKDSKDPRGHQIVFTRLRESSARVTYSRGQIDPRPGEVVLMNDMKAGAVVREGSPVPAALAAEPWKCVPE
jgi:hypothetical protein